MCDQVSDHIDRLEAEVASLRLLCDNQRKALEVLLVRNADILIPSFACGNQRKALEVLLEAAGFFNDIVTAILSANTMTGTDESGGEE